MDRVARRGPLARAPGELKVGHFRNCQHFCRSWRGTLRRKNKFSKKKSHNAEKLKGGPFEDFQHPFCRKKSKNWRGEKLLFSEKDLTMPKKTELGDPLGFFNIPNSKKLKSQNSKKLKGGPFGEKFFSEKKSRSAEKNWKWAMLRGKTGKTFLVQFARPNGATIFCRTFKNYFGQFVWIEKRVTIIVAFHFMKRRLKNEKYIPIWKEWANGKTDYKKTVK